MKPYLITALFFFAAIFSVSYLQALHLPFGLLPIMLIIGSLILHRSGSVYGVIWFAATAIFSLLAGYELFFWWSWILIGILGVFLVEKMITNRSVYALIGLGLILYAATLSVNFASVGIAWLLGIEATLHNTKLIWELFIAGFIVIALYTSFLGLQQMKNWSRKTFLTN